ncbi:transketolase family protein [Candidatus Aerophobetes bacterium]|uniref:Transketolase family protein n=1 Tax=Aerophobetes bacterium TaxID=2030807 RepID=A0A662D0S2_UNCAE|nr:MAG: transketolase family protein [Candidatus Aerophobetes bacterium]
MEKLIATRDAFGEVLVELGERYENLVVLTADLAESTRTYKFANRFPNRFFNIGIAEQNMMGIAAGLASCGKIVVASSFAIFASGRAWEQVRYSICHSYLNVKIVATHGGISVGEDGSSHQAAEDISLMRTIPGMRVLVPADAAETKKAVEVAVETEGPFYIRLGRPKVPLIFEDELPFQLGKGYKLTEGSDVTIFACGIMLSQALEAEKNLRKEGIRSQVINMSTIKPIDRQIIIEAAKTTGAIVTAEEHQVIGGLGSAVSEVLSENIPTPLERVGLRDRFGESGKPQKLFEKYGLTAGHIEEAVKKVLRRK